MINELIDLLSSINVEQYHLLNIEKRLGQWFSVSKSIRIGQWFSVSKSIRIAIMDTIRNYIYVLTPKPTRMLIMVTNALVDPSTMKKVEYNYSLL